MKIKFMLIILLPATFYQLNKTKLSTVRKFITQSNTYSYTYTVTVRLSE